ncbi:MAG: hypothetical protein U9P70_02575 [Patescibacteria group bacterium]|nr:hypothetical protein [Patescibacteria group bacterium]
MKNLEQMEKVEENTIEIMGESFEVDEDGFVSFSDVASKILNGTTQQISRYADGRLEDGGYPNLAEDLRFSGKMDMYHSLRMHKDDVEEFVKRVEEYREKIS